MDYFKMSNPKRDTDTRIRDVVGTLPFTYKFGVIGAGLTKLFSIADDKPDWKKFMPFNMLRIVDVSGVDIDVFINSAKGDNYIFMANGSDDTYLFPKETLRFIVVKNLHATTDSTTGKVVLQFAQAGLTSDTILR